MQESEVKRAFFADRPMIFLVYKESYLNLDETNQFIPSLAVSLLQECEDVFPEKMSNELPPIRGIEYQIDFVPGAAIPNRPAYRSNPKETKELQRQVEDLMSRGYVRESMSPCAVPVDGNQGGPSLKDLLQVPDGPIARSKAKKIKEAMQGLVQSTWDESSKSPTIKVGLKEGEPILIHLIQAVEDMT
jgi:hypothetical protein